MRQIFRRLYAERFPIRGMEPVAAFGGSDNRSMAADNTSAFNCRYAVATGPKRWSVHAYGEAIDVDPLENPYLLGGTVYPPAGRPYLDRSDAASRDGRAGRRARGGVRGLGMAVGRPLGRVSRLPAFLRERRLTLSGAT